MNCTGAFMYIAARPRHPVIFQVPPAALKRACEHRTAMAMAPELSTLFDPEDIRERTSANIESQVADIDVLNKRNPRRFVLAGADVHIRARILSNDVGDAGIRIDRHETPLEFLAQFRSFEAEDASTKENRKRNRPAFWAEIVRLSSN